MTDHSWIRKIFKNKFNAFVSKKKKKQDVIKPNLLPLEDRLVPAVPFVQTPFAVQIQPLYAGQQDPNSFYQDSVFSSLPSYKVSFSYPVTGVDPSDFQFDIKDSAGTLTGSAVTSTVTQVTPSEYLLNVTQFAKAPTVSTFIGQITVSLASNATISQALSFAPPQNFAVGAQSQPNFLDMGDVNRDGKLDIVTVNTLNSTVSVLLGNGDGTFQSQATFATGASPTCIELGDVNGDGKLDIATSNGGSNNVSVLLGTGNGTFGPKTDFATGSLPKSITLGDVNNDGRLDIVTANLDGISASVLLGNGNGTFGPKIDLFMAYRPNGIKLADVNNDGRLDIVTANLDNNNVSIALGNGNGTFKSQNFFATANSPLRIELGDLNGDGRMDIVTANHNSNTVSVLLGNGNGTFRPKTDLAVNSPIDIELVDVNGDGLMDIVTANRNINKVEVFLGNGNGTFKSQATFVTGFSPNVVALGDVNSDGKLDIVTCNNDNSDVSVLLANGGNSIGLNLREIASGSTTIAWGSPQPVVKDVQMADVNGDGNLDLLTSNYASDKLILNLGNGNGTFKTFTTINAGSGARPYSIQVADINRDGKLDIVTSLPPLGRFTILLGNGDGKFKAPTFVASKANNFNFVLTDINNDGILDIVTEIGNGDTTTSQVGVLLGSGDGKFQAQKVFSPGSGVGIVHLANGDVNGDGNMDIVTANYQTDSASILLGNGNGTFATPTSVTLGDGTKMVALADMNNDGKLDLVSVNKLGKNISIALGNGNGTFLPSINQNTLVVGQKLALSDFNADGKMDIAVLGSGSIQILGGNGDGTAPFNLTFLNSSNCSSIAVGDANRDGIPDLVSGGNYFNLFFPMRFGTNSWQSSIVTPFQNLAAPSNLSVTNGDRNATINFQKSPDYPDESGTITAKYQYHLDGILLPAFTSQPSSPPSGPYVVTQPGSTSATVYGIVNGTNYTLKIRGNYDSIYNYTTQSLPITLSPTAVPPVPAGPAPVLASATNIINVSASVPFTQTSGSPTGYEYNLNNTGWVTAGSSTSPLTFTGLTAGTSYTVRLRAVYSVSGGANPYSDASNEITFTTLSGPLAPTNLVATPGVGSATIAFTVPADGGSPITNYEYKVGNGAWTALNPASTTSPVTITGLTGGSALSIQLRGVNFYGGGTASTAVTVTPIGAPSAPISTSVVNSNGKATISFSINNGGAPITSIEYSLSSNGGTSYSPWAPFNPVDASSPVTISGLTNGTTYLVKLRGINSANLTGSESAPITVAPVPTVPEAPTNLTALSGNTSATIYFDAADNGGSPITNYMYSIKHQSMPLASAYMALNPADITSPVVIPGLANNSAYTITLKAVNSIGDSVASTSVQVTPSSAKPLFVNKDNASFTVGTPARFDLLATGSPTYTITGSLPAGITLANGVLSGTPTASGLYTFTVNATNASGTTTQAFSMKVTSVPAFTTLDGTLFTQNSALSYTVSANDPKSPIVNSEIFNSNFSALPDGWTTQGNAAIVNGAMQLTSATSNQKGWLTLPSLGANNPNGFYAKFDLLATGGSGADGTSFNYGVPATFANVTNSELSILSSGLSIGFVEYQDDRVEIRYNGTLLNTVYTPIDSASAKTVEILVDAAGSLTLWMDGKAITSLNLGTTYTNTDKSSWQFGFGARTAASTNRHEIDNLSISSVGISYSLQQNFFESNFTSASLPNGWQIGGSASVTGGNLELNPVRPVFSNPLSGYLVLPALGATSPTAFRVNFDYAASNELDDGQGATLNYGVIPQNPTVRASGNLLPASGTTGLSITFEEDFGSDITVRFNGNQLANQTAPSFVSGSQAIQVTMTEAGYLTVTVGSTDVITNLLVPGYASADKSAWQFGFGAIADNGFSSHSMDNLKISGQQTLPAGLSLNPLTGLLSGTPTGNAANYGFNIVSTNSAGTATQAFTLLNTNTQPAAPAATYLSTNIETSTSGKTYRLAPGYTLPVGMFLTPDGLLRGTVPQYEQGAYLVKFIATNTTTQVETSGYYVLRFSAPTATVSSTPYADPNPGVNNQFGSGIYPLATGNVLVHAPGAFEGKGAIYLYNGYTGNLISSLRGSTKYDLNYVQFTNLDNGNVVLQFASWDNDLSSTVVADAGAVVFVDGSTGWGLNQQSPATISASNALVGSSFSDFMQGGIIKLPNGNYLVRSFYWDNGTAKNAGAVTFGSGITGVSGVISSSNSLVGTKSDDMVGTICEILPNGNYVVTSALWDNGTVVNAGAVTFGNGITGVSGAVSSSNSLVGTSKEDTIGNFIRILSNGNYVVLSRNWDNGTVTNAGAVTLGNGITGITGAVSSSNSLVGTNAFDQIGSDIRVLANGNFVISSNNWSSSRGAFTWVDGNVGLTGAVSSSNSLVGSTMGDSNSYRISSLSNGNYVINVPTWDNGTKVDAGASVWGNGLTGVRGVISAANSLVGSSAYDQVGLNITNLANGNYILPNTKWDNGTKAVDVGAVTWVDGNRGITGTITSANSRLGTTANQYDSFQVVTLSNGNYVILAPKWDNGNVLDAGAVTFANGSQPLTGTISSANSLVGTTANQFSFAQVKALSNGNYVVYTPLWDSSTTVDVGALTWGSGTSGVTGTISSSNSLVGSKQDDFLTSSNQVKVYNNNPTELIGNGNLLYSFEFLDKGSVADAGAVVWVSGSQPTTGVIGSTNSLVGSKTGDLFGASINRLPNGNYVVASTFWDNGSLVDAGAVTWGNGSTGTFGSISSSNSLVGTTDTKLSSIRFGLLTGSSNYLISNPTGTVNGIAVAGFVTWANGTAPLTGTISSANSLVGSSSNDNVGNSIFIFENGNYAVLSQYWNEKRGAVTFGNGNTGVVGVISEQNSLVGTSPNDQIGFKRSSVSADATLLISALYDDPSRNLANVGAVTLFDNNIGTTGKVNSTNSYIGNIASSNTASILTTYDPYNRKTYAYFANETVAGFSNNGAINPSVIQPNINTAPTFTSPNNKTFKVGNNDSFQIVAKGLPEEITYSLQSGNLPNGITLTAQGLLSGTAVAGAGAIYNFTVRATNSTGFTDQAFTLTVTEEPVITSTGPLPAFVIGSNVANYPFTATGFPAPTFSTNDALPKGVTLNPSTGLLSGTPVNGTEGTYEFTLIASSGENLVAKKTFSLTVNSPVNFTSAGGTSAHNGVASTFQVKTTGAPPANSFSLTGSVPTGVTIDNNGLISIASTTLAGNYSFSVNASNGFGSPATQPFTLEVFGPPSITSSNNASFTIGTVGSFPFSASGNPNTFTFSTSDALPAGLVLSAQGVLSGTPEDGSSGSFTVDVKAYNGASSTSQSFTIQIAKAASSVSLVSGSNGSVNPGTPVTLTATVTGGAGGKGGLMTFKDGSTVIGTAKVDPGTGVATLITDALASGSHNLTAEYSGNTAFLPSSSSTVTQVVRTVSTTTVTSSNLSAAYQSSVTFTATLGSPNATGTVDFYDGSTLIAQGVALSSGVATFTTSNLSAGSHSITAVYNGDSNFTTSTSSAINQSVIATSTTALASSASSAVAYNTAVTFTATVTGSAGTPTGTVQFYIGETTLGSPVTLNGSGVATYTSLVNSGSNADVPLPAGNLGIRAVYSGDSSYSNSTSSVVTQVVNATTSTAVSSAGGSSLLGSTATFVARVTNTSGANSPTAALVSFYEGSILLGTASASPVATTNYSEATFTTSNLAPGNRSITAVYAGDPQTFFSNSESQSFTHSVVLNTTTTVTATPANAFQNDQVTFSATVARTSAGATPTGTVTFFNGNTQIGNAVTLMNGVATLQTTFANAGSQNISAQYSGNNGVTSTSEGTITKQISETQASSTVVTSSAIAAANGSPVTFTATVSGQTGTPTGTVTFFDGNTQLGSAVTLVNGVATMQTSTLSNGNHFIRAEYTSNSNAYGNSTSTKLNQRVNQAPAITSLGSDSFLIGTSRTFNFTATGFPAPSFSTLGILPKGLQLSSDGVLTGVPATGTGGIYSFTVVASNDFGQDASVTFTLTVNEPASFTSPDTTTFTSGTAESFRLAAKGFPAPTFRVANGSSLPAGLTITSSVVNNETEWYISGTPNVGTGRVNPYTFVLEAVNNIGTAVTQTFNLTINEAPSFTSPDSATFTIGSYTNSFTLTTAGFPAPNLKLASELPAGMRFQNGVLSGTPLFGSDRSYSLKFVASNNTGDVAIQNFTLNIAQVDPTLVCPSTTNDRTPSFSGTAEPGSQIELTITRVGSNTSTTIYKTTSSGLSTKNLLEPATWSIDLGSDSPDSGFLKSLADGNYIVTVTAIDAYGNRTTPITGNGTAFVFTVDATPPAAPVITLASISDTGVPGDLVTSNTRPTISGTAEANSAITLLVNNLFYTTTASGAGAWSVNLATAIPTIGQSPMAALADGVYDVEVTATDSFGNTSQPSIMNVVIDSTAPIAPAITSPIVTSDITPVIFGNAEINSVVTVVVTQRFNNATISGPATFIVNADANGGWILDLGTAVPTSGSIQPFANNAESYEIVANARDAAGNQNNAATGTLTLSFDRDVPQVLSAKLTNLSFPVLSGKANANDTLLVVVNSVTYSTSVNSQGIWSMDTATATVVTGNRAAFTDGTYPVNLYYQGATPSNLVAQNLVVDRTAPVISNATASFGTILNQKNSNQSAKLSIAITGIENEQTVTVTFNNATYTGMVFQGEASVTIPASALSALVDGSSQSFSITAPDLAGNVSQAFTLGFTVDKSGPPCPTFVSITTNPNGDIGTTPFTGYTQPVVTFRGEPGQTLVLSGPAGIISTDSYTVVETPDTSNLNQPASFYVITFTSPQASGDYQIKLVDQNGNENANETSPNTRANNFFNINSVPVVFDDQGLRSTQDGIVTGNLQVANVLNGQMFTLVLNPTTQQLVNPRLQSDGSWIDLDGERVTFGLAEGIVIETDTLNNPVLMLLNLPNESSLTLNVKTGQYTYTPAQGPQRTDNFQVYVTDASGNRSRLQLSFNNVDTMDRDGIAAQNENTLASLGGNSNGDLNQDGTADNRQASVSSLAWRTQQDFLTSIDPETVQNTNSASIISMVVNATAFDSSVTTTLAQLMSNVDPLAQLLQIGVLSTNGLVADQPNLYKPWDILDFTVESLVSTGLNDINPNRDGTQIQVSIDISRANIPTTGLGFNLYRKYISANTISAYADAGISLTDLSGNIITTEAWYDFTQRTPGGDGATFRDFNNDGKVDAVILTLTDNSFGDNNPIANRLRDPGTPGATISTNPGGPNPSVPTPPGSNPNVPAAPGFIASGAGGKGGNGITPIWSYNANSTTASSSVVPFANFRGEVRIVRADTNNDGVADIVSTMGPGGLPTLKVIDGATQNTLLEINAYDTAFRGGIFVTTGDINNDGIPEIITGAGSGGGPHVKVFNAQTGAELASFFAYDPSFTGGISVAAADMDGNGIAEIITGAGPGGGPHVKVFNTTNYHVVKEFMAYDPSFRNGIFVAAGDFLSDGKREIITGAGPGGGPHVKIWDYATLNVDGQFMAYGGVTDSNGQVVDQFFSGGVHVALADVNGDNINEILTGAGPGGGPHVKAFAGFNLELLLSLFAGEESDRGGVSVG